MTIKTTVFLNFLQLKNYYWKVIIYKNIWMKNMSIRIAVVHIIKNARVNNKLVARASVWWWVSVKCV